MPRSTDTAHYIEYAPEGKVDHLDLYALQALRKALREILELPWDARDTKILDEVARLKRIADL